ncbi:MAG: hypothetical protein BWX82_00365 [Parcubacteria group bacterium ADurb.Bin115]|nr:MAG: hypothetical protein BWX82_00365 [Parcubacteria group bacterium ADurb.Bin115]
MKKALLLSVIFLFAITLSGCGKPSSATTWQGSYYKNRLQENEIYGPVFTNFEACKSWALGKIVNKEDTANCSKNCHDSVGDTPVYEEVVRNWAPFPSSNTFENYKE